jgi:hypothetical protein
MDHKDAPGIIPSETLVADASGVGRSNTTSKNMGSLKKRFSIRRRKQDVEV